MNRRTNTVVAEVQRYHDDQTSKAMMADLREREAARYHKAFVSYLTTGSDLELKDLQAGSDPAGGYLVSRQFMAELIGAEDGTAPFGQVEFKPNALAKYVKASKKLLRVGGPFAERVITEAIAEALA